jgi:hypothetical protein
MKLLTDTELKHGAGFRKGCLCRYDFDHADPERVRCSRVPAMGCAVHDKKSLIIDDPEAGGSDSGAYVKAGYDKDIPLPPPESVVHGKLGDPAPGPLFLVSIHGANDVTLTGIGLALRMDRATLTALWRSTSTALDQIETLESKRSAA